MVIISYCSAIIGTGMMVWLGIWTTMGWGWELEWGVVGGYVVVAISGILWLRSVG